MKKEDLIKNRKLLMVALLLVVVLFWSRISEALSFLTGILKPFILGGALAFILNLPLSFLEKKVFRNLKGRGEKFKRPLSIFLSLVFVLLLILILLLTVVPEVMSAANQREELERYAKDKGYEVAAAVAADGISGVHTEGIMNFLLNEAKRQGIGTILARDTSRISRDTSSFMSFERKFRENGIRFEYLSKPDNELPVTPMMEAFAAAYKKRRTKNGTRA